MAQGPGVYDDLCQYVVKETGIAEKGGGVILIVLKGNRGTGFSVIADAETTLNLPAILDTVSDQIREEGDKLLDQEDE
jgi:hypothetical protein